ncbi:MAG TPA: roadblock/LC7 domain-containing protein [Alphaproteobacteria bacterium]|nr:roadblock/LC7 domain-containing protein [Alphaproteobacteria bacterium]
MATLPQLIEEDIRNLNETLQQFIAHTDTAAALLIDRGGFLITHLGDEGFDLTTIAALASGAFLANQTIAGLVNEPKFNSIYQQGENFSMFVISVDEQALLVAIFRSQAGVGVVKYFASTAIKNIARQLKVASERAPGQGLDLSMLNVANAGPFFRRK